MLTKEKNNFSLEDDIYISSHPKREYSAEDTLGSHEDTEEVPLIKLAFARSGDKGNSANIGVIARNPEYTPYIKASLSKDVLSNIFHVNRADVELYDVPGINAINIVLNNSLGGGGMSSLNIDPQGKAYAQRLLTVPIKIPKVLFEDDKTKLNKLPGRPDRFVRDWFLKK